MLNAEWGLGIGRWGVVATNEEQRKWLARIDRKLSEFAKNPTRDRLLAVGEELRKLCVAVAATAYTDIELLVLRSLRDEVCEELLGLFDSNTHQDTIAAECGRLHDLMERLGRVPAILPTEPEARPESRVAPARLTKTAFGVGNGFFWDANYPDIK
ncbi:hypothetical protein ACU686_35515 [Yinghuangia aomiensis]